jgi:hypothetical protein
MSKVDAELRLIGQLTRSLEACPAEQRLRVLDYLMQRFEGGPFEGTAVGALLHETEKRLDAIEAGAADRPAQSVSRGFMGEG